MKRIDSTVKAFPGHVVLHDPIPLVKIAAFRAATRDVEWAKLVEPEVQAEILPVLLPMVAEWHIENFPENVTTDTFPGTPAVEASELVIHLVNAVIGVMRGEKAEPPNA